MREGCVDENTARGYTADYARDICEGEFLMYGDNRSPLDEASDDLESATSYFDCMTNYDFDPEWEDFCQRISEPVSGSAATPNTLSPTTIAITKITTTTLVLDEKAIWACKVYESRMAEIQKALDANFADWNLKEFLTGYQGAVKSVWDALVPLGSLKQSDVDSFNKIKTATYGEYFRQGDKFMAKFCPGN